MSCSPLRAEGVDSFTKDLAPFRLSSSRAQEEAAEPKAGPYPLSWGGRPALHLATQLLSARLPLCRDLVVFLLGTSDTG